MPGAAWNSPPSTTWGRSTWARPYRLVGDQVKRAEHLALGRAEAAKITDAEDRAVLDGDLASLA
jgi:hypothetical protein